MIQSQFAASSFFVRMFVVTLGQSEWMKPRQRLDFLIRAAIAFAMISSPAGTT